MSRVVRCAVADRKEIETRLVGAQVGALLAYLKTF